MIPSFQIDHTKLKKGLYVSNVYYAEEGVPITTFDIRMKRPYAGPPMMSTGGIHALEHLGAAYLRTMSPLKGSVIYFGPMGCRTGFYLILAGEWKPGQIWPAMEEMFRWIASCPGPVPGATMKECGNCGDMDLSVAVRYARDYLDEVLLLGPSAENTEYPE